MQRPDWCKMTKISLSKSLKRKVVEKPSFNDEWTDNETMLWQNNYNTTSIIIENEEHEHNDWRHSRAY